MTIEGIGSLPPLCEFPEYELAWADPDDGICEGAETWLALVDGDKPSPLCTKHARMLATRLDLDEYGIRIIRA